MEFFVFKILAIAAVLAVLCLPFFPSKFKFSLASAGYSGKERWKNICFVLETFLVGSMLLCLAPYLKRFLVWLFDTKIMRWLTNIIPDRLEYIADVVTIIAVNLAVCILFLFIKKSLRRLLDTKVFKDSGERQDDKKSGKKDKKKNKKTAAESSSESKDVSEKRLRLLRRDSVLVFGRNKRKAAKKGVIASDYRIEKSIEDGETEPKPKIERDESLSLGEFIKLVWRKFIGIFYSEDDNYEYVKTGTYKWAKELKTFLALVSLVYLAVCLVVQIPIYFNFEESSWFYKVAIWLVSNTYMYPVLSLVFLFELLWFLNGEHKEPEQAEASFVSFVDSIKEGKPAELEKSRNAILEKYGKSYRIKNFDTAVMGGKSTYNLGEKKQFIQNMAKAIRANKGFINGDYMQSIEYMFDGKHVLFDSSLYSALGEYIVHYLFVTLSFGKRVLFICEDKKEIENAAAYLESSFKQITKTPQILWRISTFEKMHEGEKPDILLLTPEQFLERSLFVDGRSFFDELVDVFVLDADKILTANNYYCLIMAKKLEKATTEADNWNVPDADRSVAVGKRVRYSFFSNGHIQSLGNSIRQFFNLEDAPLETFHSFGLASNTEVFVWHTGMSSTLYVDNGANQVALEVQIAKDAGNFGIPNINLISETAVYSSQLTEIQGLTLNSCDLSDHPVGYVIVADDCFNLPNAIYNYSRFSGRKATVLHVVSKPYLLRDYFTARAEDYVAHFELIGNTMSEHAEAKRASIIVLLCDAVNGIERNLFISRAAELLGDKLQPSEDGIELKDCVKLCYETALGSDDGYEPKYVLKREQDSELSFKTFVYIKESKKLFERLLECTKTVKLEYANTQSEEYIPVFKDEITQHFIPGQVIARNNRGYTIKDMNVAEGILSLDDTGPSVNVPMDYIQTRIYNIANAERITSFGNDFRTKNSVVAHIGFDIYDTEISVDTVGYYSIEKSVQSVDLAKPNFAKYVNLSGNEALRNKLKRDIKTKMLVVELDTAVECTPHITYTLSVMLHEFMKTVFPHQYRCVSVCPLFEDDIEQSFFEGETAIRDLYPRIKGLFQAEQGAKSNSLEVNFEKPVESAEAAEADEAAKTSEKPEAKSGRIRFAIIEDIEGGNGVVESLVDGNGIMITNLLHVAADFLAWLGSAAGRDYNYLNFGYEQTPSVFDLAKTEEIIRQFRHEVERSELVRLYGSNTCFFCRKQLEDGTGMELEDGRTICPSCVESSVASFEELDECFKSVVEAIKKSTSVPESFPEAITVDFVSTAELRERYGENGNQLPIAYCNHIENRVFVEYGLPKVAVCAAIAQMVTELWQDKNIVSDGSDIYLAHPVYVAIQALSLLRYGAESEALAKFHSENKGLAELTQALHEFGSPDSFAYFLGSAGKKGEGDQTGDDDQGGDDGFGDNVSFIAERDPNTIPRYYYNRLSEDEKAVYDQIYEALCSCAESTGALVRDIHYDRCGELLNIVIDDNPDIFWTANPPGAISYGSDGLAKNVIFKYCMTPSEVKRRKKQIEKAVKPFLKGIKPSMSDYEVALRAHENIVELIDYDSLGIEEQERDPNRNSKPDNLRSVYGVFVEGKAVCAGYARAYQYLLNRLGIECSYVIGPCHSGEWHAWNLVKLEGDYYYVDVTFDDRTNTDSRKSGNAEVSYDYFCITTQELLKTRNIHKSEQYPECTAVKCNYFIRSKLFFKDYDAERIGKLIVSAIKAGKKEIAFKTESASVLALLKRRLVDEQGVFDILRSIEGKKQTTSYSYYTNNELNILHIIVG